MNPTFDSHGNALTFDITLNGGGRGRVNAAAIAMVTPHSEHGQQMAVIRFATDTGWIVEQSYEEICAILDGYAAWEAWSRKHR